MSGHGKCVNDRTSRSLLRSLFENGCERGESLQLQVNRQISLFVLPSQRLEQLSQSTQKEWWWLSPCSIMYSFQSPIFKESNFSLKTSPWVLGTAVFVHMLNILYYVIIFILFAKYIYTHEECIFCI